MGKPTDRFTTEAVEARRLKLQDKSERYSRKRKLGALPPKKVDPRVGVQKAREVLARAGHPASSSASASSRRSSDDDSTGLVLGLALGFALSDSGSGPDFSGGGGMSGGGGASGDW